MSREKLKAYWRAKNILDSISSTRKMSFRLKRILSDRVPWSWAMLWRCKMHSNRDYQHFWSKARKRRAKLASIKRRIDVYLPDCYLP